MTPELPELLQAAAAPGGVTILRAENRRPLTKSYAIAPNGTVKKVAGANVSKFRVELEHVANIHDLHRLVVRLDGEPDAVIIRGAPLVTTNLQATLRRSKPSKDKRTGEIIPASFGDTPRAWAMLDLDGVTLPAGMSVLSDPEDVAQFLVEMVVGFAPELEGVTAVVGFSSSAGITELAEAERVAGLPARWDAVAKPGNRVGGHVFFWLKSPQESAALKRWADKVNADAGGKLIDPALFQAIQLHFTARPIFGQGLRDPLAGRRVVLVKGIEDAAELIIPEKPTRGPYVPRQGDGAHLVTAGYAARLEAIGKTGFHREINSAIAAYVAANWPSHDEDALLQDLQRVIEAADPGDRAAAEIERYADEDNLRARIAAIVSIHEANEEERKAEAARAEAVEPTFPSRAVPLAEGQRRAGAAVARFAEAVKRGERPDLLLQVTVGGGKTENAVQGAAALLDAAREAGREGALFFLVPRHDLGGEIVSRIQKAHPDKTAAIWRGMDAPDPDQPGKEMCHDRELTKAAQAAGVGAASVCPACPLKGQCGYQRQKAQKADFWIAAHNLAFQAKPGGLPKAAALVVDEGFWSAAVVGNDGPPIQVAVSSLRDDRTGSVSGVMAQRLVFLRNLAADVLERHEAGGLMRDAFIAAGFTAESAGEWHSLEWATKPALKFGGPCDRDFILEEIGKASEAAGFLGRRAKLAGFIRDLLAGDDARSVNAHFVPNADLGRGQGAGPAVRVAWREGFAQWSAEAPRLFLDATTSPELVRVWAPDLQVENVEIEAPGQTVVQVADREFGRRFFTGSEGNVTKLADLIAVELAKAGEGDVLVIVQKAVEDLLRPVLEQRHGGELHRRLHLAHHGALTGMDRWRGVSRLVVVGRPATTMEAGERMAELLKGRAVEVVAEAGATLWPTVPGGIRMADGTGCRVDQPRHPDPLVEACRWSITEGAVLQAIGRARGVQRPGGVHVTLLAALALPLTVERVTTWADLLPDRLAVAVAEAAISGRAMPLAPLDMVTARPDLWASETAAKRGLAEREAKGSELLVGHTYKTGGPFRPLIPAQYRKPGARRWSEALVPPEAGRAALEAVVGPLAAYQDDMPPGAPRKPVQAPGAPPAPVPALELPELPPDRRTPVLTVLGVAPPFEVPMPPELPPPHMGKTPPIQALPATPPPSARDRLAEMAKRLDRLKPPRMLGDGFDELRVSTWRDRCARIAAAAEAPAAAPPIFRRA